AVKGEALLDVVHGQARSGRAQAKALGLLAILAEGLGGLRRLPRRLLGSLLDLPRRLALGLLHLLRRLLREPRGLLRRFLRGLLRLLLRLLRLLALLACHGSGSSLPGRRPARSAQLYYDVIPSSA